MITEREQIIDQAFHHTENQYVIKRLLIGKTWMQAMGIGGTGEWHSTAKGIEYKGGLITLSEIYARLENYKKPEKKCNIQLTMF